jgi:TonB family protein
MSISGLWRLSLAVLLIGGPAASALAQESEPIERRVEQLYASADYDQALALLDGSNDQTAHLYRALCLLALGRQLDSQRAVESLVAAAPEFTISAEEVPPRFLMLLTETRRALLPGLLRKLFTQAREQYQAKAYDRAVPIFEKILSLSEPEDLRSLEDIGDLRVLSEGFVDLAKAPQAPPPPQTVAAAPVVSPVRPPARRTDPRALKQEIPPWPRELAAHSTADVGSVRIQISSSGRVTGATIIKSINPRYDIRLLAATRFWEYAPATLNGVPTESESVVEIKVNR